MLRASCTNRFFGSLMPLSWHRWLKEGKQINNWLPACDLLVKEHNNTLPRFKVPPCFVSHLPTQVMTMIVAPANDVQLKMNIAWTWASCGAHAGRFIVLLDGCCPASGILEIWKDKQSEVQLKETNERYCNKTLWVYLDKAMSCDNIPQRRTYAETSASCATLNKPWTKTTETCSQSNVKAMMQRKRLKLQLGSSDC